MSGEFHTSQQFEGQEHEFLKYSWAQLHFIYSFTWDIEQISWAELVEDLAGKGRSARELVKGWRQRRLHERSLLCGAQRSGVPHFNYQPNLVTKAKVLEKSFYLQKPLNLLAPIEPYSGRVLGKVVKLPFHLGYTVRLFDNGGATCTLVAELGSEHINFEALHFVLRLSNNLDSDEAEQKLGHLTNSFIELPSEKNAAVFALFPHDASQSLTFDQGYCSLHDLFRALLKNPPPWAPAEAQKIWMDSEVLDENDIQQNFQSPFVFTVCEVERSSFLRFRKHPSFDSAREVGSILCKLTLDNRYIMQDYLHLSEDYIKSVLPFNQERRGLLNLCLDRRLFFTLSRRGAIAITSTLYDIPSCFVVPSLLNLCEILRVRWHMSSAVSTRLDQAITFLTSGQNIDAGILLERMFKWRAMLGAFLRDPVPFLFDGGSVAEIAEIAEEQLWLHRLRIETGRKFDLLDALVRDYLNLERLRRFDAHDSAE